MLFLPVRFSQLACGCSRGSGNDRSSGALVLGGLRLKDAGELGRRDDTPSIPTVALQVGQNGLFVFVVKDDDTVEMRNVATAGTSGEMSSIDSGLQAGERVVIDGQHQLAPGAAVAVEGAVE